MKWNCCTVYRGRHGHCVAFVTLDLPFCPTYGMCLRLGAIDVHVGTTPLFDAGKEQWEVAFSDVSDAAFCGAESIEDVAAMVKAAGFALTGDVKTLEIRQIGMGDVG